MNVPLSKLLHRKERVAVGMPWWTVLFNISSKSSKIVHFSQICYTFMSCSVISYHIDVVVVLIICQLLSKTCNVILSAPRSWRQVCAIRNLRKSLRLLMKVRIAKTCLHDLGVDKMTLQVLLRSWEMMSILKTRTTTSLIFEKLSKMNCAVTAYSL